MKSLAKIILVLTIGAFALTLMSACNKDEGSGLPTLYSYDPGDAFTTNIKNSKKMLKCAVVFKLTDEKSVTAYAEQNDIIRDAVIEVLVSLTEDDVLNSASLEPIKARLVEAANIAMNTTYFYSASFTEFAAA